jgi:hypothetical protein
MSHQKLHHHVLFLKSGFPAVPITEDNGNVTYGGIGRRVGFSLSVVQWETMRWWRGLQDLGNTSAYQAAVI